MQKSILFTHKNNEVVTMGNYTPKAKIHISAAALITPLLIALHPFECMFHNYRKNSFYNNISKLAKEQSEQALISYINKKKEWASRNNLFENHTFPPAGNFSGTNFSELNLKRAMFKKAKLKQCSFKNAICEKISFRDCDLSGSNFDGVSAHNAVFRNADLTDISIDGADFSHADFRGAKISPLTLAEIYCRHPEIKISLKQRLSLMAVNYEERIYVPERDQYAIRENKALFEIYGTSTKSRVATAWEQEMISADVMRGKEKNEEEIMTLQNYKIYIQGQEAPQTHI